MEGLLFVHGLVDSLGQILRSLDGYYEKKQLGLVSPNLNLEGFFAFAGKRLFWEKNVFGTKPGEIVSF